MSAEPSMEDILSSIKRIISEEGDGGAPQRPRKAQAKPASLTSVVPSHAFPDRTAGDPDEVLELHDPMPVAPARPAPAVDRADPIVSTQTAQATRGALDSLSRLLVRPEPDSDGTLEGMVRELLRPMLREWIDANLPQMVEAMVAREITRITGEAR